MRYWVQERAPAGNWADSIGTDDKERAIAYAKAADGGSGEVRRVVERTDVEIFPRNDGTHT